MLDYSFTFGGVDIREKYGLYVGSWQDVLKPALRARKLTIAGRDGAWDFGAHAYDERQITVRLVGRLTYAQKRELAFALSEKHQLRYWEEPDLYYIGRVYNAAAIARLPADAKQFTVTFICEPFAYGKTTTLDLSRDIQYAGTASTPTRIEIKNTGSTAITKVRLRIRERSRS